MKIFNEKLYQAKNGRTPQQVYDEDLTHTERTFVDILGMKPGANQTSNDGGLGTTSDTSLDTDASYTSLSEQSGLGTGNGFLSKSRPDFKGMGFGLNQGLSDGTGFGRNINNGFNQNTTTNNNPWSGLDTTTRPVADNSKYEWSNTQEPDYELGGTAPVFPLANKGEYPDYLKFNGSHLYWMNGRTNEITDTYPAISGKRGFQCKKYQNLTNTGPHPEGEWQVKQDRYQNFWDTSIPNQVASIFQWGSWPGSIPAWGTERIWLEPASGTDTQGRVKTTIHGGLDPESAGCIDLTNHMGKFADKYRLFGDDMRLIVEYPTECW